MIPLISLDHIDIKVDNKNLLKDINLDIMPGELIKLTGPNGCGKTTLLETIIGLRPANNITRNFSYNDFGYLPQMNKIFPKISLTLNDVCNKPNLLYHDSLLERHWSFASGGEKMKSLISRTLNQSTKIAFLDEPFNHLDFESCKLLTRLIQHKVESGTTVVYIGHEEIDINQKIIEVDQWSC